MTTGPTDGKVTTPAGGPGGMPLALASNEGLGFFGERQKTTHIGMKQFLGVWDWMIWRRVAHVVEVVAMVAAVFLPSFVKGAAPPPWQCVPEFCDSRLKPREDRLERVIYTVTSAAPVNWCRVEPGKLHEDRCAELCRGRTKGDIPLDGESPKQGDKSGQKSKDSGGRASNSLGDVIHALLLGVALVALPMFPVFMAERRRRHGLKKPNV